MIFLRSNFFFRKNIHDEKSLINFSCDDANQYACDQLHSKTYLAIKNLHTVHYQDNKDIIATK